MGLDQYLNRMPRYEEVTANQVNAIENYFDWLKAKEDGKEYANCTLKEWCGHDESELPDKEVIEYFRNIMTFNYPSWDTEKKYGSWSIIEQVGYWRKANAIHNWFVENVQDGEDDCCYHNEVTEEMLELLRVICVSVIKNPKLAEQLLPTTCGFFFGSTDYDEFYFESLQETIDIIDKVLAETDFDTQMIYYVSSW